jgi:DHA1 family tetracycline resistance protein-like MFS transporter
MEQKEPKQQNKIRKLMGNFSFLKANLLILTISWMVWFPALRLTDAYAQPYIKELGASIFILGIINSIATVTLAITRPLGGYIADRYGRKNILCLMSFAISSTYLLYALAPSWELVLIAATLNSLFLLYQPALLAIRADSVPPEKRGFGFALSEWLPGLVSIPAPIIATYLVITNGTVGGMRIAYVAAFILGIAAAIIRLLLKETLPERKDKRKSGFQADFRTEYSNAIQFIFKNMRNIALLYIIFNFAYMGALPLFSIYAVYFMQLGDVGWGIMYTVSYVLYLLLLLPVGLTVDRFGRKNMLLFSIASLVLCSFIYAIVPLDTSYTLLILVIAYSVILLANVIYANAVGALEADYIPREKRGRVTAALAFVAAMAGAAGQALGGFEYSAVNQRFPFIILTVFMVLSFFVVLFKVNEPKSPEQ